MAKMRTKIAAACLAAIGALSAAAVAETVSTVPVIQLPSLEAVGDGAVSTIIRDTDGVTVNVHTRLEPGPHTLWLLVWNDPSRCSATPCSPSVDAPDSVLYAGGNLIISTGRAWYGARLGVGETGDVIGGAQQLGLTDPMGAEVHAVLRSKGPVIIDRLEEQLSNFGGGCDVNQCANVQGAAHVPGAPGAASMQHDEFEESLESLRASINRLMVRNGLVPD
jgi:hypothetical protein